MIADKNKLTVTLPNDNEILWTREFDAPRVIVFKAMHDRDLIPRWWGPRKYETIVEQMDFRPGGKWVFVNKGKDGATFRFRGEYREIVPPQRVVQTMGFDGVEGDMGLNSYTLTERRGKTMITERSTFPTKQARDAALKSGMEEGATETYERLAELVADLKTAA